VPIAIPVTIVVFAPIAIAVMIPTVIVFKSSPIAIPIPVIEALTIVARRYPPCTSIGRSGPVSVVPTIAATRGIPVTIYPKEIRSRSRWPVPNHTRRRWRADSDSNRNLAEHASRGQ
jgi:hypothetical protein